MNNIILITRNLFHGFYLKFLSIFLRSNTDMIRLILHLIYLQTILFDVFNEFNVPIN